MDRDSGDVLVYNIGINKNKNEDIVCKRLLNKLLFNNNIDYYNPIPNTKINIIVSDGNYQYHKIIKYKERKIFKVYKDKKTKRLLRDKEDNIIKDIKKDIANIKKDIKDIKNGITGLMKKTKENNKVKVA